jgi:transposase
MRARHRWQIIKERIEVWRHSGLDIFYLPPHAPHQKIVETLWRKLKYEWLTPADDLDRGNLFYQIR